MKSRSLSILFVAILLSGCGSSKPTAKPDTPEFTIQSANTAARNRDLENYVKFFTREALRNKIASQLNHMKVHAVQRQLAARDPVALSAVKREQASESELLNKLHIGWSWLDEQLELPEKEAEARTDAYLEYLPNSEEIFVYMLQQKWEHARDWGEIDNVSLEGDSAKAKTDIGEVKLRRVDGTWKIDE